MSALTPASEAEVADAVRSAAAAGRRIAIEGGGTRGPGGGAGDVLSTRGLSGITLYEPGALTLVVRAGTPLAEVEAALAAENQQLPFEPWDARPLTGRGGVPTIGGVAATNASGPRRFRVGACRDSMIGVRFVDGGGAVGKNGGRVMKNVTGLDLVKLMAGSRGTLGVITEVAFKVLPRPETTATLALDGLDAATAVAALTAAVGTPFEVTGAAHLPQGAGGGPATLLRLEGFAGSVAYRARELAAALRRFGAARTADGDWPRIRDGAVFAGRDGAVWRISVKPTDGPRLAAAIVPAEVAFDWSGGLVWALAPEEFDLRAAMAGISGHATLVRASTDAHARWGTLHLEPEPLARLSAGLRARFDPHGVFGGGASAAA